MFNHPAITKSTYLLIFLLLVVVGCSRDPNPLDEGLSLDSLALTHSYTKQFGTTRYDEPTSAITDTAGNLYVTVNSRPYSGSGIEDAYLYKYDANGNFLQRTSPIGPIACCDFDYHLMTAASKRGNGPVYVTGFYRQDTEYMYIARTIADGSLRLVETFSEAPDADGFSTLLRSHAIIVNSSFEVYLLFSRSSWPYQTERFYLMQYSLHFEEVWWETYLGSTTGNPDGDSPSMSRDASGNIYTTIPIGGQPNTLLSKHNSSGSILWSKVTHPYETCRISFGKLHTVNDIVTDARGNVYLTGITKTVNCDSQDVYIRKYDTDGNVLWTKQFGSNATDWVSDLSMDATGNLYVAGHTSGSMVTNVSNRGEYDAYLRKYDANGNAFQTRQFGTPKIDTVYDLTTDTAGNVYVVGSTWGTLSSPRIGSFDAYLRKYNP